MLLGGSLVIRSLVLAAPMDQGHANWHGYTDPYSQWSPIHQSHHWQPPGYVAPLDPSHSAGPYAHGSVAYSGTSGRQMGAGAQTSSSYDPHHGYDPYGFHATPQSARTSLARTMPSSNPIHDADKAIMDDIMQDLSQHRPSFRGHQQTTASVNNWFSGSSHSTPRRYTDYYDSLQGTETEYEDYNLKMKADAIGRRAARVGQSQHLSSDSITFPLCMKRTAF